jgi:hypothetical protein
LPNSVFSLKTEREGQVNYRTYTGTSLDDLSNALLASVLVCLCPGKWTIRDDGSRQLGIRA